ncbi:hypothetical protein PA598K_05890 [Paenibacillus sp. 598K]|uniref:hypothetical protein n=1 Tax=Paenibacillus sp. 598K TaxID=1117987 RepID=UPI000FFAB8D1|nr:hypothetical protein [Paenibacillus sp. 598K]GBF77346.1 hypothetical protein PA598K_05890 [Paenibacillus sp. 598K]
MIVNDKQRYYVSVSGGAIETEPSKSEQLTIEATAEELAELQAILEQGQREDETTALRTPIPYKSADHDEAQNQFTEQLIDVYRAVYRVGTQETRTHIRGMNILEELKDTDYNHPGYEDK